MVAFGGLGGWFVVGALMASESATYLVAPSTGTAVALAAEHTPAAGHTSDAEQSPVFDHGSDTSPSFVALKVVTTGNADLVDPGWAARTSAATAIPLRALLGYAGAELAMASEAAGCNIGWSTLAALGRIESAHGTYTGSVVGDDGVTRPGIFGIDLAGGSSARITDTDEGRWDGKADIDRAVGPMQFIPATWEIWGADGNGDGVRDPQHIDDATLAAARYLCHYGDLSSPDSWRRAIFAYNHLDTYVDAVAQAANDYARRASG